MVRTPNVTARRTGRRTAVALLSAPFLALCSVLTSSAGTLGTFRSGTVLGALNLRPAMALGLDRPDWQALWIGVTLVLACALASLAVHRLLLRALMAKLNGRLDERLAERTRIAQELHDTLLPGFLSASMQVQAAANRLPADSDVKAMLNRASDLMRRSLEEARNAVCGLRTRECPSTELAEAFSRIRDETMHCRQPGDRPNFRVIRGGSCKALHPAIRDEVYWIGREAPINSFRHSNAKNIEIEVQYGTKSLRVLVRDDGLGIDPDLLAAGRHRHWGLSGMRERAERIGSRLSLWSRPRCGTEVDLSVPARLAFHDTKPVRRTGREFVPLSETAR